MDKPQSPRGGLTLTDSQFKELKEFLRSYLKVAAFGAVREVSEKELWRNTWLLNVAGYDQIEIARILQTSQPTISRILSGKLSKKEEEQ